MQSDAEGQAKSDEPKDGVPTLNQNGTNSAYLVYYYPVMQDFMSQPTALQARNSNEPFPLMLKQSDASIQMPPLGQQMSVPSFQFGGSTPFLKNDEMIKNISNQNHFASYIINEQLKQQNQPARNRIVEGTQTLCDVEIVLISRYFDMKAHVFCAPNNKYTLKEDRQISNVDWLKDRMQFRYKKTIKESFGDLLDQIEKEGEQNSRIQTESLKFDTRGFETIERQVPKSVKQEKPFNVFIYEIQQLLSLFIFTKY